MANFKRENLHAKAKRMVVELQRGKENAIQLQTLLEKFRQDDRGDLVSAEELSVQISRSFSNTLSELSSCAESTQIAAVDRIQGRRKTPEVRDRRGRYKRRKNLDSLTVESSTTADGFAWRKYGQKPILESQYPRCYYRCSHKYEGCNARKQVQQIKENPTLYQTTYINNHTCSNRDLITNPNFYAPHPKNLISFNATKQNNPMSPTAALPVKLEVDDQSEEVPSTGAKPTTLVHEDLDDGMVWDVPGIEEMGSGFQTSCDSFTLQYGVDDLEVEDDQFGDIGSLFPLDF